MLVYSNYGNVIVSYSLEVDVTFTSTHKKGSESNPLRCVHEGKLLKLGFEVGLVHKRAVKSEFVCVCLCTKVKLLVCVYW